jgi:uncharacterized protein
MTKAFDELSSLRQVHLRNIFIKLLIVIPICIAAYFLLKGLFDQILGEDVIAVSVFQFGFYGCMIWWIKNSLQKSRISVPDVIGTHHFSLSDLRYFGYLVCILFFSIGSFLVLYYAVSYISPSYVQSILQENVLQTADEVKKPILYNSIQSIFGVIIAPIIEEIFFRGVLLHVWAVRWGITRAIFISSIIFALAHIDIFGGFMFALMMSIVYIKTRSLYIPIVLHMLNNLFAFSQSWATLPDQPNTIPSISEFQSGIWFGLACMILTAPVLVRFLRANWPHNNDMLPLASRSK